MKTTNVTYFTGPNRILVKKLTKEETTKSGIVIPKASYVEPVDTGTVVLGCETTIDCTKYSFRAGDTVFYNAGHGAQMTIEDTVYEIVSVNNILVTRRDNQ
jgi:co-chaperonin GroES (HSP10)